MRGVPTSPSFGAAGHKGSGQVKRTYMASLRAPRVPAVQSRPSKIVSTDAKLPWACDAEEWQDAGGVAGLAAQRGGDVAVTVPPQDGDRGVAQAGHDLGRGAGA
jgi:hypothetical protein